MNKQTRYAVIGIGIASILSSVYVIVRGGELTDWLSGLMIGASLIVTALVGTKDKRKKDVK